MGVSGRIARFFLQAQITPLLALVALLLGAFAVAVTPREEEPQINVTMANVVIPFPGASVKDVEQMVAVPAEQVLSQIAGTEHVTSVSRPGLKLDVVENEKEYLVKAEIPGAKKEDIRLSLEGNYLSITAEVKDEKKETRKDNGARTLVQELHYGSLTRGFTLPHEVDQKRTSARFENGVLSITLPKRAPTEGTRIAVQ